MKFGSLFSGIGGFDLGFEQAGMKCAWQCEIDKPCQDVLRRRFGAKIYDDVRTVGTGREPVELICGGFPCQDLSVAGKRKGLDGERSGLWFEFARIIEELKPKWVVIENVPGLLSSSKGADFAVVLSALVEYGYGVCWRILDAQNFGVAQRRRRVFIVGSLGNGSSAKVLFESEGMCRDTAKGRKTGKEVTGSTVSSPDPQWVAYENRPQDSRIRVLDGVMQTLDARMGEGGGNVPLVQKTVGTLDFGQHGGSYNGQDAYSNKLIPVLNDQGGSQMSVSEGVTSTLRSQEHGHQPIVNGVRRLTPTECERLQGFPDGWTDGQADTQRYKQLGNAVAVPVARWIGERIMSL